MILRFIIPALWLAWLLYWMISAIGNKKTVRREGYAAGFRYRIPTAIGVAFFAVPLRHTWLAHQLVPHLPITYWLGVAFVALGLGFTVWARVHLGSNWSGIVTVKKDHELIRTGPYRWVRHPIYTGLLVAFVGAALALGQWRGFVGLAFLAFAFIIKLRMEEKWMSEVFGEQYTRYQREVAALIPGIY